MAQHSGHDAPCEPDSVPESTRRCRGHHHTPEFEDTSGPRLLAVLALNFIIPVAQIFGGILATAWP